MRPTVNDLPALVRNLRLLADRLERDGKTAHGRIQSWQTGTRSPSLDLSTRGWRYDDEGEPVPNDPVGEAATQPDDLRDVFDKYLNKLTTLDSLGKELDELLRSAVPTPITTTDLEELASDGWCVSCHRDGGYCEPVHEHKGQRVYADRCRWCGDFKRVHAQDPPLTLLRARREGRRVTESMVTKALRK